MKWCVYNVLFALAYCAMLPAFLLRMRRRGGYRARMADRFGRYPPDLAFPQDAIWVHAVSVGEVQVAGQLMRELRKACPGLRFTMSTTSSTGWKTAVRETSPEDTLIYNPLDFPPLVRRAFDAVRPRAIILAETEIWPNFLREARRRGIPVFLANARISDRSAPRYRALRWFFGEAFRSFTRIYAQSDLDAARLAAAGADPAHVSVTGSFKFDVARRNPTKEDELAAWLGLSSAGTPAARTASAPTRAPTGILLGGSTWPGEDAMLLKVYRKLLETHPQARLVIAPRHFEKADAVEANIRAAGFTCVRRSRGTHDSADPAMRENTDPSAAEKIPAVFLADTTGELMGLYGLADVAFVGKSLCAHGSQNMIEPCLCGVATVTGPYTENFRPVMSDLLAADALVQAADEDGVTRALLGFFTDPAARIAIGARAEAAVSRRRGVTARCAADILRLLATPAAVPANHRT